jgi:glycosyltransferase involved in cell wall biosynthesis
MEDCLKSNKYSIILPVHNGGEYVKICVNSILNQTLEDFNLIILENNSNDGTLEWLRSLNDSRIVIHTSESRTLTIEENWARTVTVTKNEFVTLIGHDDILMPDFLKTIQDLIVKHPDASLYHTHFTYIDANGEVIRRCKPMDETQQAHEFLSHFLSNLINSMGTGFVMRSKDYDRIGGIPTRYPNLLFADFELWIKLTQLSYKVTAFDTCFSFRLHTSMTTSSADIKFHKAFGIFIEFLKDLKNESLLLKEATERYGLEFIDYYCKGLAHRLLRTPMKSRNNLSVANHLKTCKEYAAVLVPNEHYNPTAKFNIRLAKLLDSSMITRSLFLLFKMIYKKPVYQE